jgi:PDZ domain-containing secreted protein
MTIVAINGIFYRGSVVMGTEVSMKDPGETVEIEVLTHENTKKKFFVTLESS